MKKLFLILSMAVGLLSCQNKEAERAKKEQLIISRSDSLTTLVQQEIMKNLMQAIEKGGPEYAVDFCHAEAIPLTNAAVENMQVFVQRISDKNRNPDNNLKTKTDKEVFKHFTTDEAAKDTLILENKQYVYYKRINLAMPTCLKCHGSVKDIEPGILAKLEAHYPNDKAKDYTLHELRGLWKLTYKQEE